jgi:hypothetical protein
VEEAVPALSLFGSDPMPQLTHGICDDCSGDLQRVLWGEQVRPVLGALQP